MSRKPNDVGPKLREEKHFQDFYPDLEPCDQLPIIIDDTVGYETETPRRQQLKQLIFNGTVTLEPINIDEKLIDAEEIPFPVSKLSGTKYNYSKKNFTGQLISKYYDLQYLGISDHKKVVVSSEKDSVYETKFAFQPDDITNSKDPRKKLEELSINLRKFLPQYDMDEQDALYIEFLNNSTCKNTMTEEIFELFITILELEWFDLEKRIPPKLADAEDTQINTMEAQTKKIRYELYGSDDGTGLSTDQACAVCDGTISTTTNAIVFCDGCDIAVHQECYGIVFIPEGQWLCRRCFISRNKQVNCVVCPSSTGAFKQTHTGSWAHVLCALWMPELNFANLHYMEPIEGVEYISKSRWKLVCYICKLRTGACIQCSNKNCFSAFHVTCAKRAGLCLDIHDTTIAEMASNHFQMGHTINSYCDKHSPPGWPSCLEGIMKTRRYFANKEKTTDFDNDTPQEQNNGLDKKTNQWKTARGTPIAPHYFGEIIQKVANLFGMPNEHQLSFLICKYWSMKRELKKGAPLVRIYFSQSYNSQNETHINNKIDFIDTLLNDLRSIDDMSLLIEERVERTRKYREDNKKLQNILNNPNAYFFQKNIVQSIIDSNQYQQVKAIALKENIEGLDFDEIENRSTYHNLDAKMDYICNIIENDSSSNRITIGLVSKLRSLTSKLLSSFSSFDYKRAINYEFEVNKDNGKYSLTERSWKGPFIQHEEGLSDVEELTPAEVRKLDNLPLEDQEVKPKKKKRWKRSY
ncbi:NuA3 HAT complex component NTO1 [Nakaseomyces bracarensis]|uniref:NuA3 HAT complex component NTO1 n=1 Tax=Nakaseomyces bracarensis TaxID=273131 RepID=A0ABR4P0D3_9SACH